MMSKGSTAQCLWLVGKESAGGRGVVPVPVFREGRAAGAHCSPPGQPALRLGSGSDPLRVSVPGLGKATNPVHLLVEMGQLASFLGFRILSYRSKINILVITICVKIFNLPIISKGSQFW